MESIVDVYLWGTKIGALGYEPGQTEIATFEYDKKFIKMGIEVSPLFVPIKIEIHTFNNISYKTFHGLPGFVADALPDKFGNQLIDQYFSSKGKVSTEVTALDRLLYIGNRSMGALEFKIAIELEKMNSNITLKLQDLSELAELVISNKVDFAKKLKDANRHSAINLLKIGSSAGGARSKALVAITKDGKLYDGTMNHNDKECKYYLLKFDSSSNSDRDSKDPKGMTKVEYIYSLLAKECGINIPHTDYIQEGEDFHFLIERFDRIDREENVSRDKLHYVSWSGIAHAHRDIVGAYSYEQLVTTIRELDLGNESVVEIFRRAIFNIIGRNQDDHTKNFGFLMNREGKWSLSPAFDLTYSFDPTGKWTKVHQINLNGKQDKFTKNDIIEFGKFCNLKENESLNILEKIKNSFLKFEELANEYKVDEDLKTTILLNLRTDI